MTTERAVLVLGGSGAVGRALARILVREGTAVTCASRHPSGAAADGAAELRLDARDPGALRAAARGSRAVVDVSGLEDVEVSATVVATGADLIDVSADAGHLRALGRLDGAARAGGSTVLTGVGLAPGLTNLLALDAHGRAARPTAIDLDLVLGLGEHHGAQATRWMLDHLAAPSPHRPHRVPMPGDLGRRTLHPVAFAEQDVLSRDLGVPVVSRVGLDPPTLGALTVHAARLPGVRRVLPSTARWAPRLVGRDRWTAVARTRDGGTASWATGRRQNTATALVVAQALRLLRDRDLPDGVHDLHEVTDLAEVAPGLGRHGVTFGVAPA